MTLSEYTTQYNALMYEAGKCREMCQIVADSQEMPEERKDAYLSYYGLRGYELEKQAAELRMSYYGTLQHNIYS